ncbi:MAG TPA: hypothetical protein PLQ54_08460 [Armatimonadota bacterium]|nr:hypothetical protein [Armatimonadota bacterium]
MTRAHWTRWALAAALLAGGGWFVSTPRPAQADAADDLVRQVAQVARTLEDTNRELESLRREVEGLRKAVESARLLQVDPTSSSDGPGIPVVIQNP